MEATQAKPRLKLVGMDGNAFMLMGLASRAAKSAGWDKARIDSVMEDCQSGDYNHLLQVLLKNFNVS